jgi:hypothetical protein
MDGRKRVWLLVKCTHLEFVKETYGEHLGFTLKLSSHLLLLSIISVIHGLIPWIFTGKVSNGVKHIGGVLEKR